MGTRNEKCLDPWHGFFIILAVCIVILVGIFNEFRGSTHHSRIHARQSTTAMAQAAFANSRTNALPTTSQIAF